MIICDKVAIFLFKIETIHVRPIVVHVRPIVVHVRPLEKLIQLCQTFLRSREGVMTSLRPHVTSEIVIFSENNIKGEFWSIWQHKKKQYSIQVMKEWYTQRLWYQNEFVIIKFDEKTHAKMFKSRVWHMPCDLEGGANLKSFFICN